MADKQINVRVDGNVKEVLNRLKKLTGVSNERMVSDMVVRMAKVYSGHDQELGRLLKKVPTYLLTSE